jgi:hypothetical protein
MNIKSLFGPSRKEIWRQLSTEIGAQYVEGGFWKGDKVQASHGGWMVTLDTYTVSNGKTTVVYTRMRAPYDDPTGFRFTIYRKGLFTGLGKWLGMQDVNVGYEPFDEAFVIKGNDEGMLRALFSNAKLRDLIDKQKNIHFTVKRGALHFHVTGVIKDIDRLKLLFDLFGETLEQLQATAAIRPV